MEKNDDLNHVPVCNTSDIRLVRVKETLRNRNLNPTLFVIDDEENIIQAARAGVELLGVFISSTARVSSEFFQEKSLANVDINQVEASDVREIFGSERLSRVFALAKWHDRPNLTSVFDRPGDIVVLDGVRLMGNIGAIVRNACAFGAAGVVLIESDIPDLVDRRLIRSSRGTVFSIPVVVANRAEIIEHARKNDIPFVVLDGGSEKDISEISRQDSQIAIVLGSEKTGPSAVMKDVATTSYRISINPAIESLNVSVAAAIALHERRR
ncbi:rRNA methylase [Corynebacterium mustelae]|uniref:rRNA methylase n=1 Tax=Corynebacterium mustelae TaxID=571915 RepID=A0A0G3GUC2_9CORY|nr:TrmH family RNA methyltransferase [Corynebacterium mustelae]AKK04771.1 rRNA methylase [Corynebacterium mustelae]